MCDGTLTLMTWQTRICKYQTHPRHMTNKYMRGKTSSMVTLAYFCLLDNKAMPDNKETALHILKNMLE